VFTERQVDFTILRAVNVLGSCGLHERNCLNEPCLEIGEGLFSVVVFWHFHPRKSRSGSLSLIGCNLDLMNERKHVSGKPVIEQDF
jgi:hypothetical protein